MARKINWRDFGSIPGLNSRKMILDNIFRYVYNPGLFSSSILSMVFSSSGFYTCVESNPDQVAIGQVYLPRGNPSARLFQLAPIADDQQAGLTPVISNLSQAAGEKGAIQILAEVDQNSPVEGLLEEMGFRCYTEQQIWKLPRRLPARMGGKAWLPTNRVDSEQVKGFYQRVVPPNILRVESPPGGPTSSGLLCWSEGKVCGYAKTHFGPRGILVDLIFSQGLTHLDEYLSALIFHMPYRETKPIYLRIRSYQGYLANALEKIGAEEGPEQKALVKRLAVHYNAKQAFRVQRFKNQPDVTTPISNSKVKN